MNLSVHFLASLVIVGFLFPFYKFWSLAFLIGSFFIDVDHYIWYALKKREFSLKNAYRYHKDKKDNDKLHIFHVWEFWLVMFILAFLHPFFMLISLGLYFHLIMDFLDLLSHMNAIHDRAFSFFKWIGRNRH